jgi:nucleoside-diphosphate-sugar epimerase
MAHGWTVHGVDRVPGRWTTLIGDLREPEVRRRAVAGMDAVVHVAALHAPHVLHVPHAEFRATNVSVTDALLTESTKQGVSRFIYTSSTSVYGHSLVPTDRAVWSPRPQIRQSCCGLLAASVNRCRSWRNTVSIEG